MREIDYRKVPAIIGLGATRGTKTVTHADIDRRIGARPGFTEMLMRQSGAGIETRGHVTPGEQATSDLAVLALRQAIEHANIDPNLLTGIVVGTSSPDYNGLTTAAIVQDKLGLPTTGLRAYDVCAACPGWLHAFNNTVADLSSPYGRGGPQAVIGAEVISLNLSGATKAQKMAAPLFGDAAGATIVDLVKPDDYAPTTMVFAFASNGALAEKLYVPAGGTKLPTSEETVRNKKHGLEMDGATIYKYAVDTMTALTKQVLVEARMPIEEIHHVIFHQANLKIMRDCAEALNIPWGKVRVTIDHYGNTSSASIPTAMRESWDKEKLQRNHVVVVATFGAGTNGGAAVIPMPGLPYRKAA